jgi:tRNA(Ile)-lysidine synthase
MYPVPILLAVSGGLDSMVMLHQMLCKYGKDDIAVAHVNFQLRGLESNADMNFVQLACKEVGVQFYCERFDTNQYASDHKLGTQEAARNIRYNFFERLRKEHGFMVVATAHHQNDSIETFLINLMRGSGPEGLSGIQDVPERGIIRPLLHMKRKEIESYAKKHKVLWREDASNTSSKYMRNRVRHEVLPLLRDVRPGLEKALARNMEIQAELSNLLEEQVLSYQAGCVHQQGAKQCFELDGRSGLNLILGRILAGFGFNYTQVKDLLACQESGSYVSSESHILTFHKERLELTAHHTSVGGPWFIQEDLESSHIPISIRFESLKDVPATLDLGSSVALFDLEQLVFPLTIRAWSPGDKLQPLGMSGQKKVSDLLNDIGLSIEDKKGVYVMESAEDIIWVIGHRVDERYKVRSNSKALLKVYI